MKMTNVQLALNNVQNGKMTLEEAAEKFAVDKNELSKALSGEKEEPVGDVTEFGVRNFVTGGQYNKKQNSGIPRTKFLEFENISFEELIRELGGKETMPAYLFTSYEDMYNSFAGVDGKLSADELEGLFKMVEKYAGADKMLDYAEMKNMMIDRKLEKKDSALVSSIDPHARAFKFLMALVDINARKVFDKNSEIDKNGNISVSERVSDPEIDRISTKRDENGNLISETKLYKDGRKITTEYSNDKPIKTIREFSDDYYGSMKTVSILDENGNVTKDVYYRNGKIDRTKTYTYHDNGRVKTEKTVYSNRKGYYLEYFDNKGRKTKSIDTGYGKTVELYNEKSQVVKRQSYNSEGKLESTSKYYYKEGWEPSKIETVLADGSKEIKEITYGNEFEPDKFVKMDKNGNIEFTEVYSFDKNDRHIRLKREKVYSNGCKEITRYDSEKHNEVRKEECYDKDGNLQSETAYTRDKNGEVIRKDRLNVDGTMEISYGSGWDPDKVETFDKEGQLIKTLTIKRNKAGKVASRIETDSKGNVVSKEEFFYDAKGRKTLVTLKDGNGNVIKRYDTTYSGKQCRTVGRSGNDTTSLANIIEITEGEKTVYYKDGKTLCSKEQGGDKIILRDGNGNEIRYREFRKLQSQAVGN